MRESAGPPAGAGVGDGAARAGVGFFFALPFLAPEPRAEARAFVFVDGALARCSTRLPRRLSPPTTLLTRDDACAIFGTSRSRRLLDCSLPLAIANPLFLN